MPNLYVRKLDTDEVVRTVPLSQTGDRYVEKVVSGMLRNMNTEKFYVDDSEAYPNEED